jgi:histidyl-tRNA synthetase
MEGAPLLRDELCEPCAEHYAAVKARLDALGIPYAEEPKLVRGLDYYTRTVFEVQADAGLGAQNAIGGGGRYDRLMEAYGGKPTPGLGFALGFERTLLAMEAAGAQIPTPALAEVYVASVDAQVAAEAFAIASELRDAGVAAELDHVGRSLKSQFKQADRWAHASSSWWGLRRSRRQVTIRDMNTKEETRVALAGMASAVRRSLG